MGASSVSFAIAKDSVSYGYGLQTFGTEVKRARNTFLLPSFAEASNLQLWPSRVRSCSMNPTDPDDLSPAIMALFLLVKNSPAQVI